MTLEDRLAEIVRAMPDEGAVTLPVAWLRAELGGGSADGGPGEIADLTADEVAEALGRAPSTVRTWLAQRRVPGAYKLRGREWRIPRSGLRAFLDSEANDERPREKEVGRVDLRRWRTLVPADEGHTR